MWLPVLEEVFLAPDELVVVGHDASLWSVYFIAIIPHHGKKSKKTARKTWVSRVFFYKKILPCHSETYI